MKILLVGPDYEENLSIRYLSAALLAAGHETILTPFNSLADIGAVAKAAESADLVGLSMCFQARAIEFLRLAQRIKSETPHKLIVAGGHYASCAAEPLLTNHPELDLIVIHEGEQTLVEIAGAMANLEERLPQIAGIAYRRGNQVHFTHARPMLADLDLLPLPDRRGPLHTIAGVPTSYIMGSRGCYEHCAYCCITTLHRLAPGKPFRQRRIDRIADEMATLYHERGTRQFIFHDDNFLVPSEAFNHTRISAFERALNDRSVKDIALLIKCRPADVSHDVFRRLKALGLLRVFLGVESATERGLSSLERNQSVKDSERALEICAELNISAQFTLMTFHPDATLETIRADSAFMRRYAGNPLNFCRAEIYAGTPLERRMIESGRAGGDYLARDYSLSDPAADLACSMALDLFHSRCLSLGGLMHNTIGLDHSAAVLKRFYQGLQRNLLAGRVASWIRSVNLDTLDLLDLVIELSAVGTGATADLREREFATREHFLAEASKLRAALGALRSPTSNRGPRSWPRLGRPAAAALLAIGMPVITPNQAVAHPGDAPVPAESPEQAPCSITGVITDPLRAVIPNAKITITHAETNAVRTLSTDDSGQYIAVGLAPGHYKVRAEVAGFNSAEVSAVVLHSGACERVDISLQLGLGSTEMVAIPMDVDYRRGPTLNEELSHKQKPFVYVVGQLYDGGTLIGIATQIYGDPKKWLQIFEANRDVVFKPNAILPFGTSILIPPEHRNVPQPISKRMPAYPAVAKNQVWGDVLLDLTLHENGTVARVRVIEGHPVLAEAASSAVEKWRYRPLLVNGKPVLKFVVLMTFDKDGKVR
jgi:TonB family protein